MRVSPMANYLQLHEAGTEVASLSRKLTQRPEVATILSQPVQADQPALGSSTSLLSGITINAATDPAFSVLSPAQNATVPGGTLVVEFAVQNFVLGHQVETH